MTGSWLKPEQGHAQQMEEHQHDYPTNWGGDRLGHTALTPSTRASGLRVTRPQGPPGLLRGHAATAQRTPLVSPGGHTSVTLMSQADTTGVHAHKTKQLQGEPQQAFDYSSQPHSRNKQPQPHTFKGSKLSQALTSADQASNGGIRQRSGIPDAGGPRIHTNKLFSTYRDRNGFKNQGITIGTSSRIFERGAPLTSLNFQSPG